MDYHDLKSRVWDPKGAEVFLSLIGYPSGFKDFNFWVDKPLRPFKNTKGVRLPAKEHEQEPGGLR